jgi:hypothetical protein
MGSTINALTDRQVHHWGSISSKVGLLLLDIKKRQHQTSAQVLVTRDRQCSVLPWRKTVNAHCFSTSITIPCRNLAPDEGRQIREYSKWKGFSSLPNLSKSLRLSSPRYSKWKGFLHCQIFLKVYDFMTRYERVLVLLAVVGVKAILHAHLL